MPPNVQSYLTEKSKSESVPVLSVTEVYKKIIQANKPNSSFPRDLPRTIVQHFPEQLAVPTTTVYNAIVSSSAYPGPWKIEYQIPVTKIYTPETEDDLQNISKTPFLSKVFE